MNIQSYELPTERVAIFGRFSSGERPAAARTLEEIDELPFEGSLRDIMTRLRPLASARISCPMLVNGSFETKTMDVHVRYGGALLDPKACVDNQHEELYLSLTASAMALSTVASGLEGQEEDTPVYPLIWPALGMRAIGEILDSNWIPADGLDLENAGDRARVCESLVSGNDMEVPPTDLILAPDNAAVPFDPTLTPGAFTSLDASTVEQMYRETKLALLGAAPPDGSGYAEFLGELRLKFRDALVTAIETIREADTELARNLISLAIIHSVTPVRVIDVPGDWLVPADGQLTRIAGYARPENSSAQKETFRSGVVPRDATDQSGAALRVVLLDPIEDVRTLQTIAEWGAEEGVVVYVNVAASSLDELARTADQMQNGTPEDWGKHLVVVGDSLNLSRGEGGSTLSIPAVVLLARLQTEIDLREPAEGAPATGIAVAAAGTRHNLLEFEGDARAIGKHVHKRHPRKIKALTRDSLTQRVTRGWINTLVPRHGGDGFGTNVGSTSFRSPKPDSPERAFENIGPVRVRNWVVATIGYFLRHQYVGTSIDEATLKALQNELKQWLKSLDDHRGRRFINAEKSAITATVHGNQLHVEVKLVYRQIIAKTSVSDHASIDELTFERDEDGVWAPATAA